MKYAEQLAEKFGEQLIKPRKYNYSEEQLEIFLQCNPHLGFSFNRTLNKRHEHLETLLVTHQPVKQAAKTCIVYAHGLGSNKLQVLPILKYFKNNPSFDICSFDFSGSGKSEGKFTSFGLCEQDDINAILMWLDKTKQYEKYILWGRSMGSVAIVLSQGLNLNNKVQGIILDSPFSSFEKVCVEIASNKSYVPQLVLQPLAVYLKQYYSKKSQINPFSMDIVGRLKQIQRSIMFIYSKTDSIVSYSHSIKLKLNCSFQASQIEIVEDHNMQRSKQTHQQVNIFIEKLLDKSRNRFAGVDKSFEVNSQTDRTGSLCARQRGISLISSKDLRKTSSKKANIINPNPVKPKQMMQVASKLQMGNRLASKPTMFSTKILKKVSEADKQLKDEGWTEIKTYSSMQLTSSTKKVKQGIRSIKQPTLGKHILSSSNSSGPPKICTSNSENNKKLANQISEENLDITQPLTTSTQMNSNRKAGRLQSFYSASFMDENINTLCSINSICLNHKKFKQREEQTSKKNKENVRPSIQLRRKNRFLL